MQGKKYVLFVIQLKYAQFTETTRKANEKLAENFIICNPQVNSKTVHAVWGLRTGLDV